MINKQFNKLIPYVSENFITYPLWEEGKYIPFVNFWCIDKKVKSKIKKFKSKNYTIEKGDTSYSTTYYQIFPTFEDSEELGYTFTKDDWSIEEMINIIIKILNL
jgi:hypothetical protein